MCRSADAFAALCDYNEEIKGHAPDVPPFGMLQDKAGSMQSRFFHKQRRSVIVLFCLIRLVCVSHAVGALDIDKSLAQCRLDVWTTKDGLPTEAINAIVAAT